MAQQVHVRGRPGCIQHHGFMEGSSCLCVCLCGSINSSTMSAAESMATCPVGAAVGEEGHGTGAKATLLVAVGHLSTPRQESRGISTANHRAEREEAQARVGWYHDCGATPNYRKPEQGKGRKGRKHGRYGYGVVSRLRRAPGVMAMAVRRPLRGRG